MYKFIVVLISLISFTSFAGSKRENMNECTVESLIMGISSENFGLRTSAAFMLGELKCGKGVIPLMRMLKSEQREDARIVAALALLKIGSERGLFAIKQASRFDDSERVRRHCANFYHSHLEKTEAVELLAHH
jgi:HEAT repeat protein